MVIPDMQMEGSSISQVMVDDAEEAERVAKQRVTSKQEDLSREDFEDELSKLAAALQDLQRKASTLRHVSCCPRLTAESRSCGGISNMLHPSSEY